MCEACYKKDLKQKNPKYHETIKSGQRRWYGQNKEREHHKRRVGRLKLYGLTVYQYDKMLEDQGGGCAICVNPPTSKRLHVDHDHNTGRVRGLLCFRCNYGLSWFSESRLMLLAAARYLKHVEA